MHTYIHAHQWTKESKPFILLFAAESPIHDPKESEIETLSSNSADKMLRTLLLATATNEPFIPQSTSQRNKLQQVTHNAKIN